MFPMAHLTLHSWMSGSRWMITPLWLSGSWRSFLYSSVCSCHLFLISFASVRSIPFLSFILTIFVWNVPLVSLIFLKWSLVFPFYCFPLFLCIDHWVRLSYLSLIFFGTLHSDGYTFPFGLIFQEQNRCEKPAQSKKMSHTFKKHLGGVLFRDLEKLN